MNDTGAAVAFAGLKAVPARSCGVGASHPDLTVDINVSSNNVSSGKDNSSKQSAVSKEKLSRPPVGVDSDDTLGQQALPVRPEPVGGELSATNVILRSASNRHRGITSKSANNSPAAHSRRRHTDGGSYNRGLTLTQYGFIDDTIISETGVGETVIGLREEQLMDIAANKPDRLNARVRRQNRIKRNSKLLSTDRDSPTDGQVDTHSGQPGNITPEQ